MLSLLRKRISCDKFLSLIKRFLKAGFVENGRLLPSKKGLFQGSAISPILNNIYLHEFDRFMGNLIDVFTTSNKTPRKSSAFRRFNYLMEKAVNPSELRRLRRERWKTGNKDPFDPNFKRLYYVRYVDDFIVGVVGSLKDTINIKNQIEEFLRSELKLVLSPEKSLAINFSRNYASFLSVDIKGS